MTDKPTVNIVHCVDTEGPLYESLPATFERLREIFDVNLEATPENLRRLQNREINLGELEDDVAKIPSVKPSSSATAAMPSARVLEMPRWRPPRRSIILLS